MQAQQHTCVRRAPVQYGLSKTTHERTDTSPLALPRALPPVAAVVKVREQQISRVEDYVAELALAPPNTRLPRPSHLAHAGGSSSGAVLVVHTNQLPVHSPTRRWVPLAPHP